VVDIDISIIINEMRINQISINKSTRILGVHVALALQWDE